MHYFGAVIDTSFAFTHDVAKKLCDQFGETAISDEKMQKIYLLVTIFCNNHFENVKIVSMKKDDSVVLHEKIHQMILCFFYMFLSVSSSE